MKTRTCDRCGKLIKVWDEKLQDTILSQYEGRDICPNCDLAIAIGEACTRGDLINNLPPGTTAKKKLELYEN